MLILIIDGVYEYHLCGVENTTCTMKDTAFESITRYIENDELAEALQFGLIQLTQTSSMIAIPYHFLTHIYDFSNAMYS